jgi:lipid II:glycine glycyltransferase (peptidoglycan interpeptide bridge formation enzyme)
MEDYDVICISEKDAPQWDAFVFENPQGTVFQTYDMLKVYATVKRINPVLLGVKNKDDNFTAGMLAYISTEKEGLLAPLSRRAIVSGGPIYSDAKAIPSLIEAYKKMAQEKKVLFTEIRNLFDTQTIKSALDSSGFAYSEHLNFLIDLTQTKDVLWSKIKKSRRNAITKSGRMNVVVEEVKNLESVAECYRLLKQTYDNAKLPLADETLFRNAFTSLQPKGMLRIFVARVDGKFIGVIIVLCYKDRVYDWYAGADLAYRTYCPNDLLPWHAMIWGKENGYALFDFGGAGKPGEKYGVRDFKEQYGGELVNYGRYKLIHASIKYKIAERGFEVYRRLLIK